MISDFYPNKKTHRFISCKAACELSFGQRWVYSYLVFHAKHPTINALSVALGMKHQTVKAAAAKLIELGLAKTEGREIRACEPSQDWFARWKNGDKSWRECLGYSQAKVRGPQCPLTLAQNTLYWMLVSLAKGRDSVSRQSCAGLAKALGVDRKTVGRALAELQVQQLLFVKKVNDFFDVRLYEPDSDVVSWFQDKPVRRANSDEDAPRQTEPQQWKRAEVVIEEIDEAPQPLSVSCAKFASKFTALTETQQEVVSVLFADGFLEFHELDELNAGAEREHRHNQRTGKTKNSGHHGALLWHKILNHVERRGLNLARYAKLR